MMQEKKRQRTDNTEVSNPKNHRKEISNVNPYKCRKALELILVRDLWKQRILILLLFIKLTSFSPFNSILSREHGRRCSTGKSSAVALPARLLALQKA